MRQKVAEDFTGLGRDSGERVVVPGWLRKRRPGERLKCHQWGQLSQTEVEEWRGGAKSVRGCVCTDVSEQKYQCDGDRRIFGEGRVCVCMLVIAV